MSFPFFSTYTGRPLLEDLHRGNCASTLGMSFWESDVIFIYHFASGAVVYLGFYSLTCLKFRLHLGNKLTKCIL